MNLHQEISFEEEICGHLAAHGWHYAAIDAAHYDRARALFPADLLVWVQQTQPKSVGGSRQDSWTAAEGVLLDCIRAQLDARGTLDVLRHGVEMIGLRQPLSLLQVKPALAMNPEIVARYDANRLRVVRQVRYSTRTRTVSTWCCSSTGCRWLWPSSRRTSPSGWRTPLTSTASIGSPSRSVTRPSRS